jgi:hypothetical protein
MDLNIALRHSVEGTLTTNSRNREKVTCYIEFGVKVICFLSCLYFSEYCVIFVKRVDVLLMDSKYIFLHTCEHVT